MLTISRHIVFGLSSVGIVPVCSPPGMASVPTGNVCPQVFQRNLRQHGRCLMWTSMFLDRVSLSMLLIFGQWLLAVALKSLPPSTFAPSQRRFLHSGCPWDREPNRNISGAQGLPR